MNKSNVIQKFTKAYDGLPFPDQVLVMKTLSDSLGLIMFLGYLEHGQTAYTFYTNHQGFKGRKIISIIMSDVPVVV